MPPQPIQREAPAYPQAVRATGIEGSVEVALTVLRDGSVGWVRVVRAEPRGYFEQAATEGVRRWRFAPATQDGEAIECRLRTRVRFALTDTAATAAATPGGDRPQPVYPPALLQARIEGYAEVEYELDAAGAVKDARVVAAMPRGEFEKAALAAVRGWRGPPPRTCRPASRRAASISACRTRSSTSCRRRCSRARRFPWRPASAGRRAASCSRSRPRPRARCARRASSRPSREGLFDATALAIARGSRLSPAYRDGLPIAATALLTLRFDPARATCPNLRDPDRDSPAGKRPPPRVTRHDEKPARRVERWSTLSRDAGQPVP